MKKALKFMIPGIILLITLILIIARARSNKIPSNSEYAIGNLAGNLMNGGYFCESDGTIYFANPYDSNRLYSMTTDCHISMLQEIISITSEIMPQATIFPLYSATTCSAL